MGRPAEVFVRPVTVAEGLLLQRIGRTAKDPVKLRGAIVVLMSAQGQAVPDIAHLLDCSPEYVRTVIHAFNESGLAALDPKWSGGRPRVISEQVRRRICLTARCCPRDLDLAFSTWSLTKLADYLAAAGVARISREAIRQILRAGGVRWQATKTWKASTDPDFITKMHRVLDLYDHPPADGRVICADEFGPLNLQPRPGRAWRPTGHPARLRATYRRTRGVRHMLAALDLGTGQITYRIPRAQALAGVPGLPQAAPRPLAGPETVCDLRQLLPAQASPGHRLGHRPQRGTGVPAHLRLVAELDRTRIRRLALLRPGRHRPPHPRLARRDDRLVHPLAQRPRPAQDQLRRRVSHPHLDRLPDQRCLTRH
jgi:transposase